MDDMDIASLTLSELSLKVPATVKPNPCGPSSMDELDRRGVRTDPATVPSAVRALVADDSRLSRQLLVRSLRVVLPDARITEAESGEEALRHLTEGTFALALLDEDYGNDGITGTDVSRAVRRANDRILLIGCTSNAGDPHHEAAARSAGQDAVFGKPLPAHFGSVVTELLRRASARPASATRAVEVASGVHSGSDVAPTRTPCPNSTMLADATEVNSLAMSADEWSVVVAHLPDGELAFALSSRMFRDAVLRHKHSRRILSDVAHAITSKARLRWALDLGCPHAVVCATAAAKGELAVLKYAHDLALPWGEACTAAAANGQLDCLQYAHEHGCAWDDSTCANAAAAGHLACLQYAHEHGCAWDGTACGNAAAGGHLACLRYAHEQRCPWDEVTAGNAAAAGHLDCLRYAHEQGCAWDELTCADAAAAGHLTCLQYAHEAGCPWHQVTCELAAANGHLNCLQYAHVHGCAWDETTCADAAGNGHLGCLMYAHVNGCPWDESTTAEAEANGHLVCLKYAKEHGCPSRG